MSDTKSASPTVGADALMSARLNDVLQDDTAALLAALGLPTHARDASCHAVIRADVIQGIHALRERAEQTAELLYQFVTQATISHPFPWSIESDWLTSVESPTGRIFAGEPDDCLRILRLGERAVKESQEARR